MKILSGETDIAEYDYDALGRRVRCINYYDPYGEGNATTTDYYYSNNWQVLEERNEDGDLKNWYTYGNYIDELLMKSTAATGTGSCKMYLHDHLYSPVRLIDTGGNTYECYEYDAYGEPIIHISWGDDYTWLTGDDDTQPYSAYGNKYLFTGREVDLLNGGTWKIQYNRNRYYDYYTGRFLTQDPLDYADSQNLYEYVISQPISKADSYGLTFKLVSYWGTEINSTNGGARGWTTASFEKSSFSCDGCVLHIDLEFHLSLYVLRRGHFEWSRNQRPWYDPIWGPRPRTPDRERQACLSHELDHYTTYNVYWKKASTGLSSYDNRVYSSKVMCERARDCLRILNNFFFNKAINHSASFDIAPWWQGGMYPVHPFNETLHENLCSNFQ